jgi:hypothetical protein
MKQIFEFLMGLIEKLKAFLFTKVYATGDIDNIMGGNKDMNKSFTDIKSILGDVLGFARWAGLAICVIMLVWCAMKLATSAGNTQKRALAMDGIKNVLIAVAIIGSATLIATVAYGILNR